MSVFVIRDRISLGELSQFKEVGAYGTAAIITPIYSITRGKQKWTFCKPDEVGQMLKNSMNTSRGFSTARETMPTAGW